MSTLTSDTSNNKKPLVLVTGASRGIGAEIALVLAKGNYPVIGTATSPAGVKQIDEHLRDYAGQGIVLNVAEPASVQSVLQQIEAEHGEHGPILILINNAGITRDNLMLRMKNEEWQSVIDTNLSGIFHTSRACLRGMVKARFGRIINIGSVIGRLGNAGQANYAAAKAGMEGFTRALAREVGSRGITVNCIAPGYIATDMTAGLDEVQHQALLTNVPLGRLGEPNDIAHAVAFLVSPGAGYITGQTLQVNGGMYMN